MEQSSATEELNDRVDRLQDDIHRLTSRFDRLEGLLMQLSQLLNTTMEDVDRERINLQSTPHRSEPQGSELKIDRQQESSKTDCSHYSTTPSHVQVDEIEETDQADEIEELAKSNVSTLSFREFDVFLSFPGETRNGFTSHLFNNLKSNGVRVFMVDDHQNGLRRGDEIDEHLLKAIESSAMAISVFTKSFADSTWCLKELAKIVECGMVLLPIFYNVSPSQVRKQEGAFEMAFKKHEVRFDQERTNKWREALRTAAVTAGFTTQSGDDHEMIQKVVADVVSKLNYIKHLRLPTPELEGETATEYCERIMELLRKPDVHKIGVWGMGGVGKTYITLNVHNELQAMIPKWFEYIIFVNVPYEYRATHVRSEIGRQCLMQNLEAETNEVRAAALLKQRLQGKKFLLILDDLWEKIDLGALGVPEPNHIDHNFVGSKVLLTTRNHQVCNSMGTEADVKVEPLPFAESWEFFRKRVGRIPNNEELNPLIAKCVVSECGGLPIALVALADYLRNQEEGFMWHHALSRLRNSIPVTPTMVRVFDQLRLSYDRLESGKLMDVFLACAFYVGNSWSSRSAVTFSLAIEGCPRVWEGLQLWDAVHEGEIQMKKLRAASLLQISEDKDTLLMHPLIRSMAHQVVPPGKFIVMNDATLESYPDSQVWEVAERMSFVRSFVPSALVPCNSPRLITLLLCGAEWMGNIPKSFFGHMESLHTLILARTKLRCLPPSFTKLLSLRLLDFSDCRSLKSLIGVGGLKNLVWLYLARCSGIEELPYEISRLVNLRVLVLHGTSRLRKIARGVMAKLRCLAFLHMQGSGYVWRLEGASKKGNKAPLEEMGSLRLLWDLNLTVATEMDFVYIKRVAESARFGLTCNIQESNKCFTLGGSMERWRTEKTDDASSSLSKETSI